MSPIKQHLTHQLDEQMKTVSVDTVLKQQLYERLTRQTIRRSQRAWWKVLLPIFSVATLALVVIAFSLHNPTSTNSVATIINKTILPQPALAEVLAQTFNLQTLLRSFGIVDDGQLHHRTIEHSSIDDAVIEHTELWSNGHDVRSDETWQGSTSQNPPLSTLLNTAADQVCVNAGSEQCSSIADVKNNQLSRILSVHGIYYPVDMETMIRDLSISADNIVTWSSNQLLQDGAITFGQIGASKETLTFWLPEPTQKSDKYWYSEPLQLDESVLNNLYFQIHSTTGDSMIYDRSLNPVTAAQFTAVIQQFSVNEMVMNSSYLEALKPIIYIEDHAADFTDPNTTTTDQQHNQTVTTLHFKMPKHFASALGYPDNTYAIAIYLNQAGTQFLGYALTTPSNDKFEKVWLEDEVLPSDQADSIFNIDSWKTIFPPNQIKTL